MILLSGEKEKLCKIFLSVFIVRSFDFLFKLYKETLFLSEFLVIRN